MSGVAEKDAVQDMAVLVLRPEPDATRTAQKLAKRGWRPIIAPLFVVADTGESLPHGPFDALVVTSAHGAARLGSADFASLKRLPVFAVGAQTARVAAELGFKEIRIADGDRHSLVELIVASLPPDARLLAALGRDRHEDWINDLKRRGHDVALWTAYEAKTVTQLPEAAASALKEEAHLAALHFSQRGAETFLALADEAGLGEQARATRNIAMSAEVAASLVAAGVIRLGVAHEPTLPAMLDALADMPIIIERAGADDQDVAKISQNNGGPGSITAKGERVAGKNLAGKSKQKPAAEQSEVQSGFGGQISQVESAAVIAEPVEATASLTPETVIDEPAALSPPLERRSGPGWGGLMAVGVIAGALGGMLGHGGFSEVQKYFGGS
ncbi:MAG: uroporphyrinogen-III synthase, partial [Bosea sp. (in: a-proteobacteria)]